MARLAPLVFGAALLVAACGEFADRELSDCHPNCNDAGRTTRDGGDTSARDGGVDQRDGGAVERDGGAVERDGGIPRDGGEAARDGGVPMLHALDLVWRTTNSLHFGWDDGAVGADVVRYELRYGAQVWDDTDDANLGFFDSPFIPGRTNRATLRGLVPNTTYEVRLFVERAGGAIEAVAEGTATTLTERTDFLVVFSEELPMGTVRTQFQEPTAAPRALDGTRALWVERANGLIEASIAELGIEVPAGLTARFEEAFLDMWIAPDFSGPAEPFPYIRVGLFVPGPDGNFRYSYVSLPASGDFMRVQIPLRAFAFEDMPLSATRLDMRVEGLQIVTERPAMTGLLVDEVVIRF